MLQLQVSVGQSPNRVVRCTSTACVFQITTAMCLGAQRGYSNVTSHRACVLANGGDIRCYGRFIRSHWREMIRTPRLRLTILKCPRHSTFAVVRKWS